MGAIGKLISTKIENYVMGIVQKKLKENKDGSFFSPSGDDSPPLPDDKICMLSIDGSGKFAFIGSLMITKGAKSGEKILYSRDSNGNIKGKIYINQNGEIVLNDGTDFAVAFNKLKIEFDILNAAFNGHTHIYLPGPSAPIATAAPLPQSTAIIDNTKVEKVRLP